MLSTSVRTEPHQICIEAPCTFRIGCRYLFPESKFKGIELSTFYLSDGRIIDCLLNIDEDFITEVNDQVKQIEQDYNKHFQPGMMYGHPCLMHSLN